MEESGKITLKNILHNKTKGMLSRSVFFAYLKQYFAENVLEFWVVVQDFYNLYEPKNPRSTYSIFNLEPPEVELTEERKQEKAAETKLIIVTYISDDSPLQLNISDMIRNDIIGKSEMEEIPDGIFNDAQLEAEQLLESNYFYKFLKLNQIYLHKSSKSLRNTHLSLRVGPSKGNLDKPETSSSTGAKRIQSQFEEVVFEDSTDMDKQLSDILHLKTKGIMSRSALHGFLERRGAGSLIEFWVEVLNFYNAYEPENMISSFQYYGVKIPDGQLEEPSEKMAEINRIYSKFLQKDAEKRIAFSPEIIGLLEQKLDSADEANPPLNVFDEALVAVQKRIEKEHLQEFLDNAQAKKDRQSLIFVPRPPPPKPEGYEMRETGTTGSQPPLPPRRDGTKKMKKKGSFNKKGSFTRRGGKTKQPIKALL